MKLQPAPAVRFLDHAGESVGIHQLEHEQIYAKPGSVEHESVEFGHARGIVKGALQKVGATAADIAAVGITNQRETTVVWDKGPANPTTTPWSRDTRTDRIPMSWLR